MEAKFLYYAKFWNDKRTVYKVGVASSIMRRLGGLQRKNWECKLLMVKDCGSFGSAKDLETAMKLRFKSELSPGGHLARTETFGSDILGLDA